MIRTQIQLSDEQMRALRRLASSRRISLARLIRNGVDLIIRSSTIPEEAEQKIRALSAIGRFQSGSKDVSTKHDKYLSDAFKK